MTQDYLLHKCFSHLKGFKANPNIKDDVLVMSFQNNSLLRFYLNAACISHKLVDVVKQELNTELAQHHLRYQHWLVLKLIYFNEANTPANIADQMCIIKSTLTRLVDHLVVQALVVRSRGNEDRRTVNLELTDRGKFVAYAGLKAFMKIPKNFRDTLTRSELDAVSFMENHFTKSDSHNK